MRDINQDVNNERDEMNEPRHRRKGSSKKKGNRKPNRGGKPPMSRKEFTEASNDLSWYSTYPELVNASASFPYSWPLGNPINEFELAPTNNYRLPGMMAIDVMLTPGISESANSPITLAARNLYSWIRHDNSGAKNYEAPDLIMYVMAMDSCYALYAYLARALVYMTTINPENRYYPRQIITAMGFNYEDLHGSLAQFEYVIEQFRVKLQKCSMPAHLPLFERHRWLFSGVYTDSSTSKAQTYFFRPAGIHYWVEGVGEELGKLEYYPLHTGGIQRVLTLQDVEELIDRLMNPILGSDDFNIIAGDIRKSFAGDVYQVEPLSAFITPPIYDAEVMSQIENMSVQEVVTSTCAITQNRALNAGYIEFSPEVQYPPIPIKRAAMRRNRLVTMNLNDPKAGDTMIATRLCNIPDKEIGQATISYSYTGTELVVGLIMYYMDLNDPNIMQSIGFNNDTYDATTSTSMRNALHMLSVLSRFKSHPSICLMYNDGTNDYLYDMREIDKYTVLRPADLHHMHDCAVLSELSWPQIK